MEEKDKKWLTLEGTKSWFKSLLFTKPVLAISFIVVPLGLVIWWIYARGKKDNETRQLNDVKFTPASPVTPLQDAEFQRWVNERLVNLELDLFTNLDSWYHGSWTMSELLFEVNSLDDRKLITLNNYYQKKRKRSLRNDLNDKFLSWIGPPSSDNYRDSIVKRLEGFGVQ